MNLKKRLRSSIILIPLFYLAGLQTVSAQTPLGVSCTENPTCGSTCTASISVNVHTEVATVPILCGSATLGAFLAASTNICNPTIIAEFVNGDTFSLPKCHPSERATFEIVINSTPDCGLHCIIDPFITTLTINTGHSVVQAFSDASKSEHFIAVTNGDPGLKRLVIRVNGKDFKHLNLDDAAPVINIDAGSVMTENKNTVTFIGRGDLGSFANIVVGNTRPPASSSLTTVAGKAQKTGIWGPLVDSAEDNASDQVAIAAKQQIQLSLATSLDLSSAVAASHYVVTVKGSPVSNLQISATPGGDGTTLVLRLPTRSFAAGDAIQVNWNGLKNAKGQPLSGQVDLIAQ